MKIFRVILFLLLFSLSAFATGSDASKFAKISSTYLFELNLDGLKSTLEPLLKERKDVASLKIIDNADGSLFYSYGNFNKTQLSSCNQNEKLYKSEIVFDEEKIGTLILCKKVLTNGIDLSNEELAYISKIKKIKVHNERDWAPFNFYKDGKAQGFSIDYIQLVASKVGLELEFVTGDWNELLNLAMNKKIDVMLNIAYTKERAKHLNYVGEYVQNPIVIVGRKSDNSIKDINSLFGRKMAVVEGFFDEHLLMEKYPLIQRVVYKNSIEAHKAVEYKEVDATFGRSSISRNIINEYMLSGLEFKGQLDTGNSQDQKLYIATNKDSKVLASILKKGMKAVSSNELLELKNRWLMEEKQATSKPLVADAKQKIQLNASELKWLSTKPVIKFAVDPEWSPIEFINEENKYDGMNKDFLDLISQLTGLTFELVHTKTWEDSTKLSVEKKVDMLACVSKTPKREEYLNFSNTTIELTDGVLMRSDAGFIDELDDLQGFKVGVPEGTSVHTKLQKENPLLILVPIKGTKKAIEMLSNKEIDAYVGNLEVCGYHLQQMGLYNLKVVLKLPQTRAMHIALQKDFSPYAMNIINKAILSISPQEIQTIRQRWVRLKVSDKIDYTFMLEIGLVVVIILLGITYYNRKLKKMVATKTSELTLLLSSFDKHVIASKTDTKGVITYVSDAFCEICGYTKVELIGKTHSIIRHPDMPNELFVSLWKTIKSNQVWKGELKNCKKDGGFYWVEAVITPEYDIDGKLSGYSAIRHDITSKKEVEELSRSLEEKVELRTKDLNNERNYITALMNSQTNIVLSTDGKKIRTANKAFLNFFDVDSIEQFIQIFGDCICDTFDKDTPDEFIKKTVNNQKWIDYVYEHSNQLNKTRITLKGKSYIFSISVDKFEFDGHELETAVFSDITELEKTREEVEKILANILLPVLITSKKDRKILYANKYSEIQYEKPVEEIIGSDIDSIYTVVGQHYHIVEAIKQYGRVENMEENFKTSTGREFTALLSVTPITYNNIDSYIGMVTDITKQKDMENEVRAIHRHTRESIEYAALIQHALIPSNDLFKNYFQDYLTIWHPKDIVGGDIYLFEELRNEDECLLMVIDCTGHGVPGAFVTMLVKAIERQIVSNILFSQEDISPSKILSIFNKTMKHLLKQEDEDSISNAGFDGGVIYYNKKDKILKYAGAEVSLFYIKDGDLKIIKGDRHSIGYKKSNANFHFKEHIIEVSEGMQFYLTTDGYLDQNGGEKGFPFGKSKFSQIITSNANESLADIQEILLNSLAEYQGDEERNDDVTVIGLKI